MGLDLEQYLNDLEYIVNIDSGSHDIEGNERVAAFFAKAFEEAGFDVHIERAGRQQRPVLIAVTPGAGSFVFYLGGHLDTVFPAGTAATRPYRREGEFAYGPGTVDMKSGSLLILYVAREIMKTAPQIPLCIVLNSDEELGSADSVSILRHYGSKCKRALIFEGGRKEGKLVNQRKGIAKFQIEIEGIASHSGTAPKQGASAIVELANWITKLDKLKNYDRGTTVNVGLIEGGTALNMVAPYSKALVEVRYVEACEYSRVVRTLERMQAKPFVERTRAKVTAISHYPPLIPTAKTKALMEQLEKFHLEYVKAGGTSDANRLACLDIPIIDGCGPQGGFPHSEKEFLSIETAAQRFDLMCGIIKEIGGNEPGLSSKE